MHGAPRRKPELVVKSCAARGSKRNFVVKIAGRRLPRLAGAAAGAARALGAVVVARSRRALGGGSAGRFGGPIQQGQLAAEAADHHLGGIFVLAGLVSPFAGLQRALHVDFAALVQILLGQLAEPLVEDHHPVPFGAFPALTALPVVPAFAGGHGKLHDFRAVLGGAHLGVTAQIADENHLIHCSCHHMLTRLGAFWFIVFPLSFSSPSLPAGADRSPTSLAGLV